MYRTVQGLALDANITLIAPRGSGRFRPKSVSVIECPAAMLPFLFAALLKGLIQVLKKPPKVIIGGSGLVAPLTAILAKIRRGKSVLHVHGLDLTTTNAVYRRLFLPWVRKNDLIVANSENTRRLAIDAGCEPESVTVLNPGTDLPSLPLKRLGDSLRFEGKALALFVGRIIRRKGLSLFLANAWAALVQQQPDAHLLIVGDTPGEALMRDPQEGRDVKELLRQKTYRDTVTFLGAVSDDELWQYYAAADVLIFPIVEVTGDVEGFGMVAIEAAACGTPTVAFSVGGVPDAIENGVSGYLVEPGDYSTYVDSILTIWRTGVPSASNCRKFAENFSWERRRERFRSLLEDLQ